MARTRKLAVVPAEEMPPDDYAIFFTLCEDLREFLSRSGRRFRRRKQKKHEYGVRIEMVGNPLNFVVDKFKSISDSAAKRQVRRIVSRRREHSGKNIHARQLTRIIF